MSIGTSGSPPATELNPEGIADRTTVGVFFGQAARYGERPLVHHLVGEKWKTETWADMKRYVLAVASALVDAGVKQGDRVVLLGENRYEWLVSDFAIQAAGGVTVPIYTGTAPEHVTIAPADIGEQKIGHFGYFRQQAGEKLWPAAADWLGGKS